MTTIQINANNLSTTLLQLIEQYNIMESQLARAVNLPRATINRIKSGKITNPRTSTLILIANYFNITLDQLFRNTHLFNISETDLSIIRVPLLQWEEAVRFKQIDLFDHQYFTSFEDNKSNNSSSLFALKIEGEAMWPHFDNNSIIIIDTQLEAQNRNFIVAYIAKSHEIILRQLFIDGKSKILNPVNSLFRPLTLEKNDYIIGVVIHAKKNF